MANRDSTRLDEVPAWMRQAQRGIDWGALLVLALGIVFTFPFMTGTSFPQGIMAQHDVFRVADYAEMMAAGEFFPRWSPHTFNGYGAPIAHFYPPGSAYLAALVDFFFTNDILLSIRLVYAGAVIFGSGTLYAFISHRFDGVAGVLAALAYLSNPYISLTIPHVYGDLSQIVGIALLPTLLWSADRLLRRTLAPDVVLAALVAAFLTTTAPNFVPAAMILLLVLMSYHILQTKSFKNAGWLLLAVIMGGGLSAVYWLPVILEMDAVRWQAAIVAAPSTYITLEDLMPTIPLLHDTVAWHLPRFNPGWGLTLMVIFSIPAGLMIRQRLFQFAYLAVAGAILIAGLLFAPVSQAWLPAVMLGFIIGASGIGIWSRGHWLRLGLLIMVVGGLIVDSGGIFMLPAEPTANPGYTPADQRAFERNGYGVSVLPAGLSIPSQMQSRFLVTQPDNLSSPEPGTSDMIVISGDPTQLSAVEEQTLGGTYQLITDDPVTLTYRRGFFAGWQAYLNGQRIPLSVNANGVITFSVVSSEGLLELTYGTTWPRMLGWIFAIVTGGMLSVAWWWRWRNLVPDHDESTLVPLRHAHIFGVIFAIVVIIYSPLRESDFIERVQSRLPVDNRVSAGIGSEPIPVQMQGISPIMQHGEYLKGTLYWRVNPIGIEQYIVTLSLNAVNDGDKPIVETAPVHIGYLPALQQSDRWLPHPFLLQLPSTFAGGTYRLDAHVYRCQAICTAGEFASTVPVDVVSLEILSLSK